MKKLFLNVLLIFVASCGVAFGQTSPVTVNSNPTKKKADFSDLVGLEGQKAPIFTAAAMDGTEYNLESLRGKIVVVNLWGTFCPPCIEEMPRLNALVDKYKSKNVVFLAPSPEGKALLEGFLPKNSFKYQVLPNAFGIVKQYSPKKKNPSPTDKPGGFTMLLPVHLVIDQEGTVVKDFWGYKPTTADELSKAIEDLLVKKSVTNSPAENK